MPTTELTDEIEITAAMIAAGEGVLLSKLGGAVSVFWGADDLAKEVFLAMLYCNPIMIDLFRRRT